jgi:hypothetical protein
MNKTIKQNKTNKEKQETKWDGTAGLMMVEVLPPGGGMMLLLLLNTNADLITFDISTLRHIKTYNNRLTLLNLKVGTPIFYTSTSTHKTAVIIARNPSQQDHLQQSPQGIRNQSSHHPRRQMFKQEITSQLD